MLRLGPHMTPGLDASHPAVILQEDDEPHDPSALQEFARDIQSIMEEHGGDGDGSLVDELLGLFADGCREEPDAAQEAAGDAADATGDVEVQARAAEAAADGAEQLGPARSVACVEPDAADAPSLSEFELLCQEVGLKQDDRYLGHYRFNSLATGLHVGHILSMGASQSLKATCSRHSKCVCWVSKVQDRQTQVLHALVRWLGEGSACDEQKHFERCCESKQGFGMRVKLR